MKTYATPEVEIQLLASCDVLTISSILDFMGLGMTTEDEYEGRRINLSDI